MTGNLVPLVDPTPIPAPDWLFQVLLVLTFAVHLLFVNLTLGGTILGAISSLLAGGKTGDFRSVLAERLVAVNTFGISLTITTGIAPLLFVQVLYPQFFYSATILLGWIWLALLVLLILGYYAIYLFKFRGSAGQGRWGRVCLPVAAVLFFGIAMIQVAVNLIHSQPAKWLEIHGSAFRILSDPVYFPRLVHFLLASIVFSSAVMAWWAARRAAAGEEIELNNRIARYAWSWALWATLLQVLDGFILLFLLPRRVLVDVVQGGVATLLPLVLAIVIGLALLMMLAQVSNPVARRGVTTAVLALIAVAVVVMTLLRHEVRLIYLRPFHAHADLAIAPQWGNFLLFALLLVVGIAIVGYMIHLVRTSRAMGTKAA